MPGFGVPFVNASDTEIPEGSGVVSYLQARMSNGFRWAGAVRQASAPFCTGVVNSVGQRMAVRPPTTPLRGFARSTRTFSLSGISRDNTGAALGNCDVLVFDANNALLAMTVSDGSGNWTVTLANNAGPYWVRYYKAGSPNLAGTTDKTLLAS